MIDLNGRLALVTGGSRGIGAATVRALAQAGAVVSFSYHERSGVAQKLVDLVEADGNRAFALQADFSSRADCEYLVGKAVSGLGGLDILVHNAGIWTGGSIESMTDETWDETMRINLDSAFYLTRSSIPHLRDSRFGRIVFISSTAAQRGEAGHGHYAASKGAIQSLTKSLAVELAPYGITVNAVAPGWVITDMVTDVLSEEEMREVDRTIPRGRMALPEEIAGPAAFLTSDLAAHITGEILNVNGGSVLCG